MKRRSLSRSLLPLEQMKNKKAISCLTSKKRERKKTVTIMTIEK